MTRTRDRFFVILSLCVVSSTLIGCPRPPIVGGPNSPATCIGCHDGRTATSVALYAFSAHASLDCIQCHGDATAHVQSGGNIAFINNPGRGPFEQSYASCTQCHEDTVNEFLMSTHATTQLVSCGDCHNIHKPGGLAKPLTNNAVCNQCHTPLDFLTAESLTQHTNHPIDPADTGASGCTSCHMVPLSRFDQANAEHDHTMMTVAPSVSVEAAMMGITPIPPNSCAGITGCHDGTVPTAPEFDVDNQQQMEFLQTLYELWFPPNE